MVILIPAESAREVCFAAVLTTSAQPSSHKNHGEDQALGNTRLYATLSRANAHATRVSQTLTDEY